MSSQSERVYFIEAIGLGLIKIGYARDIAERMRKLRPGCPAPLRLLGTVAGGHAVEQDYHWSLADHRAYGEWFRRSPQLEKILLEIDAPSPPPPRPVRRGRRLILEDRETAAEIAARLT